MKNIILAIALFCTQILQAQVDLTVNGIILPSVKTTDITTPSNGYFINELGSGLPAIYNGTDWIVLQNHIWTEDNDNITYNGVKRIGIGVSSPAAYVHFNAPDGTDPFRIQADGSTKFRIFDNGAISLGTNWSSPETNTLLINTGKTIINEELALSDNSFTLVEGQGIEMFNGNGEITIAIDPDIEGDGRVISNELELTGGSDFSERFNINSIETSVVLPGMLVSIATDLGDLEISKKKRDKKVVGIVSGANGIETGLVMGQQGSIADGSLPVALSGRAYVYASLENGAIQPGDFLTTSSKPGYAMRVKNMKKAQGAIIGKALTALSEEGGFVLVLVNLQ